MKKWKHMGKRALASFLAFTLCLSMVNLAAFAVEKDYDFNMQLPAPLELEEMGEAYPWTLPGFGLGLMETAPKGNGILPEGGVWAVKGEWEDGSPVLTMDEEGNATFFEPTSPEALAVITYTYQKMVEKAPTQAEAPQEPSDEPNDVPSGEPSEAPSDEPSVDPSEETSDMLQEEGEPSTLPEIVEPAGELTEAPVEEEQGDDSVIIDDNPVPEAEGPEAEPVEEPGDEPSEEPSEAPTDDIIDEQPAADAADEPVNDGDDVTVKVPDTETVDVALTWKVLFTSTVETLANGTLVCDASRIAQNSDFARGDGNHTIYVSGEWKGTLSFSAGTVHIYAGTGANNYGGSNKGTINAADRGRSAITVSGTAHVILHDGITVKGGTGNYISKWPQSANYGHTVGGGVCIEEGTFTMYGGTIGTLSSSDKGMGGNSAGAGGGIYVGQTATFNMYGGNICNNKATGVRRTGNDNAGLDGGGGGIWVNGTAVIDPTVSGGSEIKIQNNTSATKVDLGGGGIYVNNPAKLSLKNAIITQNHADGLGGGIASCVHGKVGIVNIGNNGAAIYSNTTSKTAYDENGAPACGSVGGKNSCDPRYPNCPTHWTTTTGDFVDAHSKWQGNGAAQKNFRNAATDIFCAGAAANGGGTIISDTRPIDSSAKWTGYVMDSVNSSFKQITQANNGYIYGGFLLGLTAGNTSAPGFSGHKVTISGNTSATHGGGIATNGILALSYVHTPGDDPKEEHTYALDGTAPLSVSKALNGADIAKTSFTFELLDSTGTKVLDTATTNKQGKLTLDYGSGIDQTKALASSYTFYVREKANANTTPNNTTYKITVPVIVGKVDESQPTAGLKVFIHHYSIGTVTMEMGTGVGSSWRKSADASTLSYTNTWKTGSLTLNKTLAGSGTEGDANRAFSFRVTLTDPNNKGLKIKNVTYSGVQFDANGVATVNVSSIAPVTISDIPAGAHYKVEEINVPGTYEASGVVEGNITAGGNPTATIINTHLLTSLTVKKTVAALDPTSATPATDKFTIVVKLGDGSVDAGNSTSYVANGKYTFTLGANGTATINGIPRDSVSYTVEETKPSEAGWAAPSIPNASGTVAGQTVTVNNSYYKVRETNIEVTKEWAGDGNENFRPDSVTVQLYRNRQAYGAEQTLTAANGWHYSWGSLPAYDGSKNAYTYSVQETDINYPATGNYTKDPREGDLVRVRGTNLALDDSGYEIMGAWVVTEDGMNLKNEWRTPDQLGEFEFFIHKVDSENRVPINGVTFTLTGKDAAGNDVTYTEVTGPVAGKNGYASFTNLPKGTYTLEETAVPDAYIAAGNVGRKWTVELTKGDTLFKVEAPEGKVGTNFWEWLASFVGIGDAKVEMDGSILVVKNEPLLGKIQLGKALDLDYTLDGEDLSREYTFNIYDANGYLMDTLTVTKDKGDTSIDLRYGMYTIKEEGDVTLPNYTFSSVTFSGTDADPDTDGFQVMVAEDQKTYEVTATNHYTRNSDKLTLSKAVTGNTTAAEANDEFTFTVTIPGLKDGTYSGIAFKDGVGSVVLRAGGSKTIEGLPVGFGYTVKEDTSNGNYTAAEDTKTGTIVANGNNTAAFTNTRKNGSLTVGKLVDYDSTTSVAPNSQADSFTITVKLGSGEAVAPADPTQYTENGLYVFEGMKDRDSKTISGIPTGTTYTVTETFDNPANGTYTFTGVVKTGTGDAPTSITEGSNGVTVKNHYYQPKYTSLTVTKDWTGTPNEFRQPITVTLVGGPDSLPDGIDRTVELNSGNGWRYTWNSLPQYEGDGLAAWSYQVEENLIAVPADATWTLDYTDRTQGIIRVRSDKLAQDGNYEIIGGWVVSEPTTTLVNAGSSVTLTNNWRSYDELGTASFSIHKIDAETKAPITGVTFTLKKEGSDTSETYSTTDGELTISGLTPGKYSLTETKVADGYRDDETNKGHEWILEFVKDADHKDKLLSVEPVNKGDILGENTWSWKASTTDSSTAGEITITNEIIRGSIGVAKVPDLDGVTGDAITEDLTSKAFNFNIYAGTDTTAEPVARLSVPADGKPVYADGLRFGTYTIVEVGNRELDNYDYKGMSWDDGSNQRVVTIDTQGQVVEVTATNYYTRHTTGLQLSKTVSGNRGEKDREWHFLVELKAPAAYVELAESYWATIFTPSERVDETTGETVTDYTREFVELQRYVEPAPEPDLNEPPAEEADPAPVESAEPSEPVDTQAALFEVTLKHGQLLKLGNLPVGTTYTVTEVEAGEGSYRTTPVNDKGELLEKDQYTEVSFDNYWNYSYYVNTVNVSVQKVWRGDDESVRPTSIQVRLMNGSTPSGTVTLNERNGWSHTWQGLDENGSWSVEEVSVPEGYTVSVSGSGTSFTITNTYSNSTGTPTPTPSETTPSTSTPTPTPSDSGGNGGGGGGDEEELLDDDVPLADIPHNEEELLDEDVPLADVPQTGDGLYGWLAAALASGLGLVSLTHKRKKEDEEV